MCFRPTAVSLTKKCEKCETESPMDAEVCPNCGEKLPDAPSMPAGPGSAPAMPGAPGAPAAPSAPKMPPPPGASNK